MNEPIKYDPDIGEYSIDEKVIFDCLIQANDALTMYIFEQSVVETKFSNLYNSFNPKGGKVGQYKDLVNKLLRRGEMEFIGWVQEYQNGGDISCLSETAQELIQQRSS